MFLNHPQSLDFPRYNQLHSPSQTQLLLLRSLLLFHTQTHIVVLAIRKPPKRTQDYGVDRVVRERISMYKYGAALSLGDKGRLVRSECEAVRRTGKTNPNGSC